MAFYIKFESPCICIRNIYKYRTECDNKSGDPRCNYTGNGRERARAAVHIMNIEHHMHAAAATLQVQYALIYIYTPETKYCRRDDNCFLCSMTSTNS